LFEDYSARSGLIYGSYTRLTKVQHDVNNAAQKWNEHNQMDTSFVWKTERKMCSSKNCSDWNTSASISLCTRKSY